jgi:hypothetical protein
MSGSKLHISDSSVVQKYTDLTRKNLEFAMITVVFDRPRREQIF